MNTDSLEDLEALHYPVKIEYDDEDSLYVAEFPDLPGCSASGATAAEAYGRAQEAKLEWFRVTLEQGLPVPKPTRTSDLSGRILVRLPVSLHAALADRARVNGTSLNQYIVHVLSAGALGEQVGSTLQTLLEHVREIERCTAEELRAARISGEKRRGNRRNVSRSPSALNPPFPASPDKSQSPAR
jgi:antitoxin HicB